MLRFASVFLLQKFFCLFRIKFFTCYNRIHCYRYFSLLNSPSRLLLILYSYCLKFHLLLLQYNFIPYSFCCYCTVLYHCMHNIILNSFVATVLYCITVCTTSSSILLLLLYCTVSLYVQHHPQFFCCYCTVSSSTPYVATVQTCPLFLMLLQPHPLFLMILQHRPLFPFLLQYNLILSYVATTSSCITLC